MDSLREGDSWECNDFRIEEKSPYPTSEPIYVHVIDHWPDLCEKGHTEMKTTGMDFDDENVSKMKMKTKAHIPNENDKT